MKRVGYPLTSCALLLVTSVIKTSTSSSVGRLPLKTSFHVRNKHRERYDFDFLVQNVIDLKPYVAANSYGDKSIDFANPKAVKALNRALLSSYYGVNYWDIPDGYLCPPIPSRVDYIHNLADLLSSSSSSGKLDIDKVRITEVGSNVRCLDIGTGANLIYPLLGVSEYGWAFVGSEIDEKACESAQIILSKNPEVFKSRISIALQENKNNIFTGLVNSDQRFHCTICNPPFHASLEDAREGSSRKWKNLNKQSKISNKKPTLNFGGHGSELVYKNGGELGFILNMIDESSIPTVARNVLWFTTLVSKETNLVPIYRALQATKGLEEYRTIDMVHGQKKSRIVAWTYCKPQDRHAWFDVQP